jgi:hypothetical protein
MSTNDPENFSKRAVPRYSADGPPEWAYPPPPTEPALPPIRGTQPRISATPSRPRIDPSRSLVTGPQTAQRGVAARRQDDDRGVALRDDTARAATLAKPLIITGNGRASAARPILRRIYPRSRKTHIALIALAACAVLLVLFAASPLNAGAAGAIDTFVASSGNVFALPTLTPTPTATPRPAAPVGTNQNGVNPGQAVIIADIQAVFGPTYAQGALNISRCESGYDPNARNVIAIMGSHAEGVFQILYPITWVSTSERNFSPYDYHANILAAHEIFTRDGNSWREWACKP